MFDEVIAAVLTNPNKKNWLPVEDRILLLSESVSDYANVRIIQWDGLLADCIKAHCANMLIRGLRNGQEFEHEYQYAVWNEKLSGVETIFLPSRPEYCIFSSSAIREITRYRALPDGLVPNNVNEYLIAARTDEGIYKCSAGR